MILLVDDEKRYMDSYAEELELQAFAVTVKRDVDDAWRFLEQHLVDIELLILDIMMPPGEFLMDADTNKGLRTGVRFFERARQLSSALPIIVLTNVSDAAVVEQFRGEPNCSFCRKEDYLPFELADEIKTTLAPAGRSEER
jgi:CheY-like chemotaxis protein